MLPRTLPRQLGCLLAILFVLTVSLTYFDFKFDSVKFVVPIDSQNFSKNDQNFSKNWISQGKAEPTLAWILHFNYMPHPEALKMLLEYYSKYFLFIAIVSPTGRVGPLLEVNVSRSTTSSTAAVLWSPPCDNKLRGQVAGVMMRCYTVGLEMLQSSKQFQEVDYVVLSNDDVVLNITKVKEFARAGQPVSHVSRADDAPPMFEPPPKSKYFTGWGYAPWWPECQKVFSKVSPEFKRRFLEREGGKVIKGGCDVFFLPKSTVGEFVTLSNIVSECWLEMAIPNSLAMLSQPIKFFDSEDDVFMYRWWGIVITPKTFEEQLGNKSIVSFHPFKLSYPEHRAAFVKFMKKYKLS